MTEQSETSRDERGRSTLAALVEVARAHGVHLSTAQIERDFALDGKEPSLSLLKHIADKNGLKGRVVTMDWRHLVRLGRAVPAILKLKNGGALVIVGHQAEAEVPLVFLQDPLDPSGGAIGVDQARLAEAWTGEVLLIKRSVAETGDERPFDLRYLVGQVLRERRVFRDIGIAAFVLSLFSLVPPLVFMAIVDRILVYQRLSSLWVLGIGVCFILLFDTAFGFLKRHLIVIGTQRIDARLNIYMFNRLIGLPMDYFERTPTGMVTYNVHQIWRIRHFLTGQLFGVMLESLNLVVLLPVMFIISSSLTFIVLGIALLMFVTVLLYLKPLGHAHARVVRAETAKGTFLVECIHGIRTVKSLAIEEPKRQDWDARVAEAVRAQSAMQHLANQPQTILQPLEKLIYSGSLVIGSYMAIGQGATIYAGSLIAFSMIAGRVISPLVQIASLLQEMEEVKGAIGQVASVVNNQPEQLPGARGARPRIEGDITLSEVRFRYPGASSYALKDLSVDMPKGSVIGVMGRSGSGKTTITRLLQGLSRDYEGLIKVDGVDLREIDLTHLRSNIGVVLQDNFLFQGTIRDNIMAGHRAATIEEVIRAARLAGAEEFIERLPRGYDTFIEEGSTNLSGGQRQRIAIARALLGDPAVLILDEATSALDPDSEAIVNANLQRIADGRTMIVISHRLSSLVNCDKILVLERGELNDAGTHEQLLERCAIYRHLWMQQNRHTQSSSPSASGASHDRPSLAPAPHA
jgi:ATP-binding cassette subfamily B protein